MKLRKEGRTKGRQKKASTKDDYTSSHALLLSLLLRLLLSAFPLLTLQTFSKSTREHEWSKAKERQTKKERKKERERERERKKERESARDRRRRQRRRRRAGGGSRGPLNGKRRKTEKKTEKKTQPLDAPPPGPGEREPVGRVLGAQQVDLALDVAVLAHHDAELVVAHERPAAHADLDGDGHFRSLSRFPKLKRRQNTPRPQVANSLPPWFCYWCQVRCGAVRCGWTRKLNKITTAYGTAVHQKPGPGLGWAWYLEGATPWLPTGTR